MSTTIYSPEVLVRFDDESNTYDIIVKPEHLVLNFVHDRYSITTINTNDIGFTLPITYGQAGIILGTYMQPIGASPEQRILNTFHTIEFPIRGKNGYVVKRKAILRIKRTSPGLQITTPEGRTVLFPHMLS